MTPDLNNALIAIGVVIGAMILGYVIWRIASLMINSERHDPVPAIATVIKWSNGQVIVLDKNEQQMPSYQGEYLKVRQKILKHASKNVRFERGDLTAGTLVNIERKEF